MSYQSADVESMDQSKINNENLVREKEFGNVTAKYSTFALIGLTIILGALFLFSNNGSSHITNLKSKFSKPTELVSKQAAFITLACHSPYTKDGKFVYTKTYQVNPLETKELKGVSLHFTADASKEYTARFFNDALLDSNGIHACVQNGATGVYECPFFNVCDYLEGRW